ncbi:hypothetical protein BH10ACT11_BH10ACT11_09360 [soil metagenome]
MPGRWICLLAGLLALLLAGCGGGSSGETTTGALSDPPPLSKQEFLREANQICLSSESRIEAAADEYATAKNPPTRKQVASVAKGAVIPALEAEVQAIEALGPPAEDADQVRMILAVTKQGIEAVRRDPGSLLDGPPKQLAEANRLARKFGAAQCGLRGQ